MFLNRHVYVSLMLRNDIYVWQKECLKCSKTLNDFINHTLFSFYVYEQFIYIQRKLFQYTIMTTQRILQVFRFKEET